MIVGTAELSKVVGITRQMLNKLAKENVLSKESKGKWNLEVVIKEFINYKIDLATKPLEERIAKISDNRNPETRLANAKADLLEIKLLEKQKDVIPFDVSKQILLNEIGLLKENIYQIPGKIAYRTLRAHTKEENKTIIKTAIDEAFKKYSSIPIENVKRTKRGKNDK